MLLFSSSSPPRSNSPSALPSSSSSSSLILPQIKTCKTVRDLQQLHAQTIKTGRIRDPVVAAEILRFYALSVKHRDLHCACNVFYQMEAPNCFSWNTIIRAFSESNEPCEGVIVFRQMLCNESSEPNQYTFLSVLKACAETMETEEGNPVSPSLSVSFFSAVGLRPQLLLFDVAEWEDGMGGVATPARGKRDEWEGEEDEWEWVERKWDFVRV